jgi:hypothetical protein
VLSVRRRWTTTLAAGLATLAVAGLTGAVTGAEDTTVLPASSTAADHAGR